LHAVSQLLSEILDELSAETQTTGTSWLSMIGRKITVACPGTGEKMLKHKLVQAALLTLALAVSAHGQDAKALDLKTGNDLLTAFHACDQMHAGRSTGADTFNCVYLEGFIDGAVTVYRQAGLITAPTGATEGQLYLRVRKYLEGHPKTRNRDSLSQIFEALKLWMPSSQWTLAKESRGSANEPGKLDRVEAR